MAAYDKKLKEGAKPFLDEGEEVLAAADAKGLVAAFENAKAQ